MIQPNLKQGDRGPAVVDLQNALRRAGAELNPDGDFGPITKAAVMQFEAAHGFMPDGVVDLPVATELSRVFATAPAASPPLVSVKDIAPHLARMRAMTGVKEIPGPQDNPLILSWVKQLSERWPQIKPDIAYYRHDEIPWCGLAMGAAVGLGEPAWQPPHGMLGAVNWAVFGVALSEPCPGAIMVKARAGGHHVTLYESEDANYWYVRGGNQSDMVNVTRYPKSTQWLAYRWPPGLPTLHNRRVFGPTGNVVQEAREEA